MPTNKPTGYETYIYSHKQYPNSMPGESDTRQYLGKSHDPHKLPQPECYEHTGPLIMIEPSYSFMSNNIFLFFRDGFSTMLERHIAEQLRDALIKVCEKPLIDESF